MENNTGRRSYDVDLNQIIRDLSNHEVRIEVLEKLIENQNSAIQELNEKIGKMGDKIGKVIISSSTIVSFVLFLNTPFGERLYTLLMG